MELHSQPEEHAAPLLRMDLFPAEHEAESSLQATLPEAVAVEQERIRRLLADLSVETGKQTRRKHRLRLLAMVLTIVLPGLLMVGCVGTLPADNSGPLAGILACSWFVSVFTGIGFYRYSRRPATTLRQRELGQQLDNVNTLEAIVPLIDVLASGARAELPQMRRALARLLRQISPTDARYLPAPQRRALYDTLSIFNLNPTSLDLTTSVLYALEQIGDERALPYIRDLADSKPWTDVQKQIHYAAEATLTRLILRRSDMQTRNMLVRASEMPTGGADILLRPASTEVSDQPEQLLRASDSGQA